MPVHMTSERITIRVPDDWHAHLRQKPLMPFLVEMLIDTGWRGRVALEPNTNPPRLTADEVVSYLGEVMEVAENLSGGEKLDFVPIMQLTEATTEEMVTKAILRDINVFKVYPFSVTTGSHSAYGVKDYTKLYPALEVLEKGGAVVQFHPESPDVEVEGLLKEGAFIKTLNEVRSRFPKLKISAEHASSEDMIEWVREQNDGRVIATITPHHLFLTIDDVLGYSERSRGLMCIHEGCKPQAKWKRDREVLQEAVLSGDSRFVCGTDDASHLRHGAKEQARHACGVFNRPVAIPFLISFFEEHGRLDLLEPFMSDHGRMFYGYKKREDRITFVKKTWIVPQAYPVPGLDDSIVPFRFGEKLEWQIEAD